MTKKTGRRTGNSPALAALACFAAISASCGAAITVTVMPDGSAGIVVESEIPQTVAARMASFREGESAATAPLFNPAAVRKAAAERGVVVVAAAAPSAERFSGSFSVKDLSDLTARDKGLASSGLLTIAKVPGGGGLAFRLDRTNARFLPSLFPGIDPYVLEALSPPAVEDAPITVAEYRSMLKSLFGSKSMPAIDASRVFVSVAVPGSIVKSAGGISKDRVFSAEVNVVEALVLEKPVEFSVSWKN
ncbi:MAG: hypothetical protein NT080_07770 [Spirochaetes bacterium]|nr:hypothetical protein [Spirochaetota bacterium]